MKYLEIKSQVYLFEATLERVIDADTLAVAISRGFYDFSNRTVRLARIDAYEIKGETKKKGCIAKEFVHSMVRKNDRLIIQSLGSDSFGRIVSEVWLNINGEAINLSNLLVEKKHAIYREYKNFNSF